MLCWFLVYAHAKAYKKHEVELEKPIFDKQIIRSPVVQKQNNQYKPMCIVEWHTNCRKLWMTNEASLYWSCKQVNYTNSEIRKLLAYATFQIGYNSEQSIKSTACNTINETMTK